MLVYLDTSHFAWLERARTADPHLYAEFFDCWRATNCSLALSGLHIAERSQAGEAVDFDRRIDLWTEFSDIVGMPMREFWVLRFEWEQHLRNVLTGDSSPNGPDGSKAVREKLFRFRVRTGDIRNVARGEQRYYRWWRRQREIQAEIRNLPANASDGGRTDPVALRIGTHIGNERLAELMALEDEHEALAPDWKQAEIADLERMYAESGREVSFPKEAPSRRNLSAKEAHRILGVKALPALRGAPPVDIPRHHGIFMYTRHLLEVNPIRELRSAKKDSAVRALTLFDPYAVPGCATILCYERALRISNKPSQSSDPLDVGHAAFAPYVDLFFCDKRTRSLIQQECSTSGRAKWNRNVRSDRFTFVASLPELVKRLGDAGVTDSAGVVGS